jgi:hypothetical protein
MGPLRKGILNIRFLTLIRGSKKGTGPCFKRLVFFILPNTFVFYYEDQKADGGTVYKMILKRKIQNWKERSRNRAHWEQCI